MARKKIKSSPPAHWELHEQAQVNGRWLTFGTEFRVNGEKGRFRFERRVSTPSSEWIDARDSEGRYRSFSLAKVRTVHIKQRLRAAAK